MNADEYKNYILGFIFYKYLSEKLERYVNEKVIAGEKFAFAEIDENTKEGKEDLEHIKTACVGELGFFLRPTELFSYLVKKGKGEIKDQKTFILEDLKNILNDIEKTSAGTASEDDFKGLFDDMDLTSSKLGSRENEKNEVVVEVLALLSGIDFKLEDAKSDLLGDAYEYLIGEFAAGAGKKGGEFYTPTQVSRLLAQIVSMDKKRIKSAYDATCGSGSLLLRLGEFTDVVNYYGQELNPTTYNLARMNMILHGVHFDRFSIRQGDTLREDMHPDLKAEAIVANPPFSAQWKGDVDPTLTQDDRFSEYGRLAPKGAADYAFVTHMLHHLADNGMMAIVLPPGVLFRSGAEGYIRKYIIDKQNYLDAVIALPENLFYGTGIPAMVLVFKKCRKNNEDILFIDASQEFEQGNNQNHLTDANILKIFTTYKNRNDIKKYSRKVLLKEIQENEYNLNIPRYVDTFTPDTQISISAVSEELLRLASKEKDIYKKISKFCDELNLPEPEGGNFCLLKEYKKGIMQMLFSQEIKFKDETGKYFPKWQEFKLGELFMERTERKENSEYDLLSISLSKGITKQNPSDKRDNSSADKSNYKVVRKNDIAYNTMRMWQGASGVSPCDGIVSPAYTVVSLKEGNVDFFKYLFKQSRTIFDFYRYSQGLTSDTWNLKFKHFSEIVVNVPVNTKEQNKIADFLNLIDNLLEVKGVYSATPESSEILAQQYDPSI